MDWIQTVTIIVSLGSFTFWLFTKLNNDIKDSNARGDAQMQRIDHFYHMFIDLLKEGKK